MRFGKNVKETGYENYLKHKVKKLERANLRVRCLNMILLGISAFMFILFMKSTVTIGLDRLEISQLESKLETSTEDFTSQIETKDTTIDNLQKKQYEMANHMTKLAETAVTINNELNTLKVEYNTNMKRLQELEEREELYDKYDYALFYNGERTDVTYQRIKDVEEYAAEAGLSDGAVAYIMASVSTESHGDATAKNSDSTATGLGQLLYTTAKYVYETEMGNGANTYNHSLALDPDLNLQMTTAYVAYLAENYDGNARNVLNAYRGTSGDIWYVNAIEKKMNSSGYSLYTTNLLASASTSN